MLETGAKGRDCTMEAREKGKKYQEGGEAQENGMQTHQCAEEDCMRCQKSLREKMNRAGIDQGQQEAAQQLQKWTNRRKKNVHYTGHNEKEFVPTK